MVNTRMNAGTKTAYRVAEDMNWEAMGDDGASKTRMTKIRMQSGGRGLKAAPEPRFAGRKIIYVCSPFRPQSADSKEALMEFVENLDRAHSACRLITDLGAVPVCPHIYFPQFLDDEVPEERELAMELALAALRRCSEVFVFSEHITEGMAREIAEASRRGIPVRMFCEAEGILSRAVRKMQEDPFGDADAEDDEDDCDDEEEE